MKHLLILAAAALAGACASPCGPEHPLTLSGLNIVTGSSPRFIEDGSIIVHRARIAEVGPRPAPAGRCQVALDGAYAIPALWDMHVHVTKIGADALTLFVANGVGAVRDMGGDPAQISRLQALARSGSIVAPLILSPGPMLESQASIDAARRRGNTEDFSRTRVALTRPEDAPGAIRQLVALGADYVKIRSSPDAATYEAVLREARAAGLQLFGHPRDDYDPAEAARRGQSSFEHGFYPFPLSRLSAEEQDRLVAALVESGAAHVPTLTAWRSFTEPVAIIEAALADREGLTDPRNAFISGEMRENWQKYVEANRNTDRDFDAWRGYVAQAAADIGTLHRRGVAVFAGTDTAVPLVYPGSSLIDELETLVRDAGMTPQEALAANTWEASDFLQVQDIGRIMPGQRANIVILDADPRADIAALRQIRAVVYDGIYYDRAALDALVAQRRLPAPSD